MKILSVAGGVPDPSDALWIRIFSLVKGLMEKGNDVKLAIFARPQNFSRAKLIPNAPYVQLVSVKGVDVFFKIMRFIHDYKPDLILTHTFTPTVISVLSKFTPINLVLDMHGLLSEEFRILGRERLLYYTQWVFKFAIENMAIILSDKILCVSRHMIRYLNCARKVPINKMEYVTNGVDLTFFKPSTNYQSVDVVRRSLKLDNKFVFGYIGGLQKYQGIKNLIKAAALIKDDDIRFLIIGGSTSWTKKNIVKLKKIQRNFLPLYYSICDVLVLPRPLNASTIVAAPTKFTEYAAMGKPILTTNVGDASFLVRKYKCGIVAVNNHPSKLARAVLEFKEMSDSELQVMGKNSRKLAEQEFDWNKIFERLDLALKNITASAHAEKFPTKIDHHTR